MGYIINLSEPPLPISAPSGFVAPIPKINGEMRVIRAINPSMIDMMVIGILIPSL